MTEIYLFPGERSCRRGMGEGLFGVFPGAMQQADEILGYSVAELCLDDPHNKLSRTLYSGPAVYVVNALMYLSKIKTDPDPEAVAGYGVGEFNALLAAGVIDFGTGLQLVARRAQLLSQERDGTMATVIGLGATAVQKVLDVQGFTEVHIAEYCSPTQSVIAGPVDHVDSAVQWMKEAGAKRTITHHVNGAFHTCHAWQDAADFGEVLQYCMFNEPFIPVIANCTAKPYTGSLITECLMRQLCSPILWVDTVRYLLGQPDPNFSEVGPGKVLTLHLGSIQRMARALETKASLGATA